MQEQHPANEGTQALPIPRAAPVIKAILLSSLKFWKFVIQLSGYLK